MSTVSLTITATFEDGVLRPDRPLPLTARQQVTVVVELPDQGGDWPDNVAEIYHEIAEDDRRLAGMMSSSVRATWPAWEDSP